MSRLPFRHFYQCAQTRSAHFYHRQLSGERIKHALFNNVRLKPPQRLDVRVADTMPDLWSLAAIFADFRHNATHLNIKPF